MRRKFRTPAPLHLFFPSVNYLTPPGRFLTDAAADERIGALIWLVRVQTRAVQKIPR